MKALVKASLVSLLLSAGLAQAAEQRLINGGFETNNLTTSFGGYAYAGQIQAAGWQFSGGAGIAQNFSMWGGSTAAPSTAYAFLQNMGSISQSFEVGTHQNFTISFDVEQRLNGGTTGQVIGVEMDGLVGEVFVSSALGWSRESFTVNNIDNGFHTLTFVGLNPKNEADTTAFIDNVSILAVPVPEPDTYAMLLAGLGLVGFIGRRRKAR